MRNKLLILFFSIFIFIIAFKCVKKQDNSGAIKMKGTLKELVEFCRTKTDVILLGEEKGPNLVVFPERGAKIAGMSFDGLESENLLWIPPTILTDSFWTERKWNIGGARTWLSPEDQFYLDERDNWFVPTQMDPGNYIKESAGKENIKYSSIFEITNRAGQKYNLKFTRNISILKDVPAHLKSHAGNFKFAGFKFIHEMENLTKKTIGSDISFAGLWSLIQLQANGTLIIPIENIKKPENENYRNYFNIFTPDRITVKPNNITVKFDGKFRGKLGIAPWAAKENLAYILNRTEGNGILFIKEFSVDQNGKYLDKPWGKPSEYGDAVQIYNDDGKMGGFCEMECHAPAKVLRTGEKINHEVNFYAFFGKVEELKEFAERVLNLDHNEVTYY